MKSDNELDLSRMVFETLSAGTPKTLGQCIGDTVAQMEIDHAAIVEIEQWVGDRSGKYTDRELACNILNVAKRHLRYYELLESVQKANEAK